MHKLQEGKTENVLNNWPSVKNMKFAQIFYQGIRENRFNSHPQGQVAKSWSNLHILFAVWHDITCYWILSKDDSDIESH